MKKYLKKAPYFALLGLTILAFLALALGQGWFLGVQQSLQNKFYDYDSASQEIIIVAIDEKTLKEDNLGPLTQWPRYNYALAIRSLNNMGAAVIGVDITFPDTSPKGDQDDKDLGEVLGQNDNVVLAARYYFEGGERKSEWPNSDIMSADPTLGWINVQQDEDGFIRRIPVFAESDKGVVEAFSLAIAREYLSADPVDYRVTDKRFRFSQNRSIPVMTAHDSKVDETVHSMYINYFAAPNRFRHISFVDVMDGNFVDKNGQAVDMKDKIVIIGPTAIDLQDSYLSPVSEGVQTSGAEIHANNVQTIIEGKFLRDQSPISLWLTLILLTAVNIGLFSSLKVRYSGPLILLEMGSIVVAGIVAYEALIFVNVVYPLLAAALSFALTYTLRFILEQKERQFIEKVLGQYVSKAVVKEIQKNPDLLRLGGTKREITAFFTDIESFTTMSENMTPEELVSFLNEYLDEMTKIIFLHDGTLDKYEGDAMMAFWNAPIETPGHATKACFAALDIQQKLVELRKKWAAEGKPEINVRIGLDTGEAVVGNMGSTSRFDYTAMGDHVNLGSRLESINKQYGTHIMISENTYELVKYQLICRELDLIRVKGKNKPVRVYELICEKRDLKPQKKRLLDDFAKALDLYQGKYFREAKAAFDLISDEDKASEIFAKRCDKLIKEPPAADWDGVWNYEVK